jgi:hypothetical protein
MLNRAVIADQDADLAVIDQQDGIRIEQHDQIPAARTAWAMRARDNRDAEQRAAHHADPRKCRQIRRRGRQPVRRRREQGAPSDKPKQRGGRRWSSEVGGAHTER